jgi:1-acyl-sn-glycerol-3-phosphate acyltransferase
MEDWKLEPARDLGLPPGKRLRSHWRESGLVESLAHQLWWALVRSGLALYHRLEVEGRENLPAAPPFVLVANHSSHLDSLVLAAPHPWRLRDRIFPVAAGEVFFERPAAALLSAWTINALPLWRRRCASHALADLRRRLLEEPCVYILFPEGTRSRDGALQPFKPGLGMLVAGTPAPVVPCCIRGAFEALPPGARLPRPRKVAVRIGKPLSFAEAPDDREGWRRIAAEAEEAVRALGPPKMPGSRPGRRMGVVPHLLGACPLRPEHLLPHVEDGAVCGAPGRRRRRRDLAGAAARRPQARDFSTPRPGRPRPPPPSPPGRSSSPPTSTRRMSGFRPASTSATATP